MLNSCVLNHYILGFEVLEKCDRRQIAFHQTHVEFLGLSVS